LSFLDAVTLKSTEHVEQFRAPFPRGLFYCLNTLGQSGAAMCGMVRFYCFKSGVSFVEDVPRQDAKFTRHRLRSTGVTIYFEVDI
jgi:hypothetical protein